MTKQSKLLVVVFLFCLFCYAERYDSVFIHPKESELSMVIIVIRELAGLGGGGKVKGDSKVAH